MDKDITEHYKKLYQFALAALEKIPLDTHTSAKSQPDGPTDVRNRNPRATSSEIKEQKTFLVTYMGGNPRRLHSETISAFVRGRGKAESARSVSSRHIQGNQNQRGVATRCLNAAGNGTSGSAIPEQSQEMP